MIIMIVAHDTQNNIGIDGCLPWGRLPNDMKFFRKQTLGNNIVMGRVTYESISQPLPNRKNFVITRDFMRFRKNYPKDEVFVLEGIDEIIIYHKYMKEDFYIIGGATMYEQFFPYADKVIVSRIHGSFEGCDTKFPDPSEFGKWKENIIGFAAADEQNEYAVTFLELVREENVCRNKYNHRFI